MNIRKIFAPVATAVKKINASFGHLHSEINKLDPKTKQEVLRRIYTPLRM